MTKIGKDGNVMEKGQRVVAMSPREALAFHLDLLLDANSDLNWDRDRVIKKLVACFVALSNYVLSKDRERGEFNE